MLSHVDADGLETMERWACVPGCPVRVLDDQSGERKGSPKAWKRGEADQFSGRVYTSARGEETMQGYGDTGGASRFFYTAKASRRDRNTCVDGVHRAGVSNAHPTVKPIELMRWLVRLVTPPSGLVLDPFNGSGTTGVSAALEGFHYIGIEGEAENCQITRRRFLQAPLVEAPQGQQEQTDGQPSNEAVDPSGVPDGDTGGGDGPA
ncbi:MAG: site-specific DNA-methyltransferase [Planctomycetes bacterium]|nr:site-specific DNA-methyltransferase [Planctomycetota bacterium]